MRRLFAGWGSCRLLGTQTFHRYVILVLLLIGVASQSRGNIYQWAYVNPNDPSKGVVQSTTLCPDGSGVSAVPNANLNTRDLTKAYLINANLTGANLTGTNLTNANLMGANLTNVIYGYETLTNANLTNTNANLGEATLINANLTGANMAGANLIYGTMTNANLTGATVVGVDFDYTNLTVSQLYSTASYQAKNLQGIGLGGSNNDLTGCDFSGQNLTNAAISYGMLTNANFTGANLTNAGLAWCVLTNANLTGTTVVGDYFGYSNITASQLYSTASYAAHNLQNTAFEGCDLTNWDLSGQDLTRARFGYATLTNANLSGAIVVGADFGGTNLTVSQLYSTASYQAHNLQGVAFNLDNLTGCDLSGQNLTNVNLLDTILVNANLTNANLTGAYLSAGTQIRADFTGADLRGAIGISDTGAITTNTILPDGTIHGLTLSSTRSTLLVRNYDGNIPIRVQEGMALTQSSSLVLEFDGNPWGSTISFDPKISVTLNGELDLELAAGVDPAGLVGDSYQVFNWTGVSPSGRFASVTNDLPTGYSWDTSQLYTTGNVTLMPEPSTFALLTVGAVGLVGFALRRRKRDESL